ncbi:MAG: nitroreductase family protein [Spirochaetales bacterium]|nr:nitroreductase family protein [Spirochaetales bacterium]
MEILPEILKRRSVKSFTKESVPRDVIERICNAGRLAPNAKNRQKWRFVIVDDPEISASMMEASYGQEHVGQAPVIIAGCPTNIEYKMPNGQLSYPMDIAAAVSFMTLQAIKEGYATCWVTTFDETMIKEVLTIPYSMKVVVLLLIGKSDDQNEAKLKKDLEEIISYNHW